ncbi:MAG: hypothetical protein GY719_26195 [bacterium]|nr:hypothetical protein [bacterium]
MTRERQLQRVLERMGGPAGSPVAFDQIRHVEEALVALLKKLAGRSEAAALRGRMLFGDFGERVKVLARRAVEK